MAALSAAVLAAGFGGALAQGTDLEWREMNRSRAEYDRVEREITLSEERRASLAAEIAKVRKDSASITAALIQSAKTERKLSQDIEDITDRVEALRAQEDGIRQSLAGRREVLAEVLGALQRMGLNPPPAILVTPEDALASVRSAIMLGAVVPGLRHETEALVADLTELSRIAASIEDERGRLTAAFSEQLAEKKRLELLVAEKQRLRTEHETALDAEQKRSEDLAGKARSLKDLIAALETQAEESAKARAAEAERRKRSDELAALPIPEANQLAPAAAFSALRGKIAWPAAGKFARRFGDKDGNGGVMQGDTLATQSGAIVTAPSDGSVLYAGPFRSYGQLLILNAGDGYHVVLAGMSRISVVSGQSVLAGEPIGAMGEARVAGASAETLGNAVPELYVEFRKDGKPVDPAPWWMDRQSGRTGNGT
ncbi:murein hydrolase activator EnvC family protein [Mesorhizobium marinum]|uniref:murein hydrolase activator EnvC family protein n=1 Tax=Mesorhizobium marinum TaxID=3228790 RepID=UPI0034666DDC